MVGDGPQTVVLIHGAGCFVEQWKHTIAALQGKYRVCALDMVGAGLSDKPRLRYLSDELVDFFRAFVDAVGLERFHLVGTSMGGALALRFTELHPSYVSKLVLAEPGGMTKETPRLFKIMSVLPSIGHYLLYPISKEAFVKRISGLAYRVETLDDDFVDLYYERNKDHGLRRAFLQIFKTNFGLAGVNDALYRPLVDDMGSVTAPTLIIWGKNDRVFPPSDGQLAQERIDGSRLELIDACGHLPMLEKPAQFNALLSSFLAS